MDTYGFDGVDIDWEYPAADDRGGVTADKANFVSLLKDMRTEFGTSYGLSVTLPTSYWYLQHFDLEGMAKLVDWFNLMSYDLHGERSNLIRFVKILTCSRHLGCSVDICGFIYRSPH